MPKEVLTIDGFAVIKPIKELKRGDLFSLSIDAPYDLMRMEYDKNRKLYKVMDIRSKRDGYVKGDTYAVIDCEIWTHR